MLKPISLLVVLSLNLPAFAQGGAPAQDAPLAKDAVPAAQPTEQPSTPATEPVSPAAPASDSAMPTEQSTAEPAQPAASVDQTADQPAAPAESAAVSDSTGASTGNTMLKRISLGIGVLGLTLFALGSLAARKPELKSTSPDATSAIGPTPQSEASDSEAKPDKPTQA